MNKYYLMAVTMALLVACTDENENTPDAIACFEYMPESGIKAGNEISFIDCSKEATSVAWDFGDGTLSTEIYPKHTYEEGGEYTVVLVAINETSADTISKIISVESTINNFISFDGMKHGLDKGLLWSVAHFEDDSTGRYHEIILLGEGVTYNEDDDEFYGSGNFVNITITTDADHIKDIIGDFSNYGGSGNSVSRADYSWIGIGLETINNDEWGMPYIDFDIVSEFKISKDGDVYNISITGEGTRETDSGEETGSVELKYVGEIVGY